MRLAPAHDSTDHLVVGRSNQVIASTIGRRGQALAGDRGDAGLDLSHRDQTTRAIRLQMLLHVLAVCSGLALLVIAVLPTITG